jgi:hypothetical protein
MFPRVTVLWTAAALAASLSACASSVSLHPVGWRPAGQRVWAAAFEGLDVESGGAGGTGRHLTAEFAIHNTSLSPVTLAAARLSTGAGALESLPAPGGDSSRTVPAGETRRIALEFRLNRPEIRRLEEPLSLVLSLAQSGQTREIAVPLERD